MRRHLDIYLTTWEQAHHFAGTVLVAHKGKVLLHKYYGYADHETGELNQFDTVFKIASVTKIFTAVAILKLHEQGKIRLNDTLNAFIPDYPCGEKITLHHLLSMTSGIANYVAKEERKNGK